MSYKKSEKGQALVLIALAAVGLFGFAALSIDGGMVFSDKRHAQNAADTAALAAALARVRAQSSPDTAARLAGEARAISNGYGDPTDTDTTVEVKICNDPLITIPCAGLPADAVPSDYVQVKITSIVRTTFARIIGRQTVTNVVTAVAKAEVGGLKPLLDGAALAALAREGSDTIYGHGNVTLDIINSGVFDNSSSNCAMSESGNINYSVDTAYNVVGTHCPSTNPGAQYTGPWQEGAGQIAYPPELDIPTPSISCSGDGRVTLDHPGKYTIHPGNFRDGLSITSNSDYTFVGNGSYCFDGDVIINGNATLTANYVDILITAGDFQINGGSSLNCNYMLVHIDGGTGMHFNGNSANTCTNVTFFATTGSVSWNGTVANTFTAPTTGPHPEYSNLLIYMPYPNDSGLTISGNANTDLTGSIIAVASKVTICGNSWTSGLKSSITGFKIEFCGNSQVTIDWHPEDQFQQVDPSAIALTK